MDEQKDDVDSALIEKDTSNVSMSQQTVGTQTAVAHSEEPLNTRDEPLKQNQSDLNSPTFTVLQRSVIEDVVNASQVFGNSKTGSGVPEKHISNEIPDFAVQYKSVQPRGLQMPGVRNNGVTASNVTANTSNVIYVTPLSYQYQPLDRLSIQSKDPDATHGPSISTTSVRPVSTHGSSISTPSVRPVSTHGPSISTTSVRLVSTHGPSISTTSVREASSQGPRLNIQTIPVQGPRINMVRVRPPRPQVLQTTAAIYPFARPQLFTPSQLVPVPQTKWLCVQGAKRSLMVPQQYISTSSMNMRPQLGVNNAFKHVQAPGNEFVKVRLQGNKSGPEFVLIPKNCAPSSPPRARKVAGPRGDSLLELYPSEPADQYQRGNDTETGEAMDLEHAVGSSVERSKELVSIMPGKPELNLQKKASSLNNGITSSFPVQSNVLGLPSEDSSGNMKLLGSLSAKNTAILAQYFKSSSGRTSEALPEAKEKVKTNLNSSDETDNDVTTHFLDVDSLSKEPRVRSALPNRKDHGHSTSSTEKSNELHSSIIPTNDKEQLLEDKAHPPNDLCHKYRAEHHKEDSLTEMSQGANEHSKMSGDIDESPSRGSSANVVSHSDPFEIDNDVVDSDNRSSSQETFSMKDYKGPVDMYVYLPMSAFEKGAVTYLSINK